ncbi:MAG: hypothetical protein HYY84_10160 [Deltaproteobacteria bacterium]|nr:hypothetical protein [Deltaproteobacteria bacterium]
MSPGARDTAERAAIERLSKALTVFATEVWRVRSRLARLSEAERAVVRTVEASSDKMLAALESLGIRIDDPAGRTWDERDAVTVLVFEPTDDVTRAVVSETVKPTLFLGESLLSPGEVVVAVPREKPRNE